jgi:thiosulfate/3-mercaptopyruvate sulfurtransferase
MLISNLGLSSGHIPGSTSLPFQQLINPDTGEYYPLDDLKNQFASLDPSTEVITSCGTGPSFSRKSHVGVTASILYLALEATGFPSKKSVYDGSWTEYATRNASHAELISKT